MFMRFAAAELIESIPHHQKIPLFLEVRDFDKGDYKEPLDGVIYRHITDADNPCSLEQFRSGLKVGMFIVMLDGVDEAPVDCLPLILANIRRFREDYRQSALVCSVRPGTQLPNLQSMTHYVVKDMDLNQIVQVIQNSPFNEKRKSLLINQLKGGLYYEHQSFLSNPLLATIMLITFDDASRVPSQISIFYAEAYKALYSRHDWSKGIFIRERRTNLDIDQFAKVFRLFCFVTFMRRVFTFSMEDYKSLISEAIQRARFEEKAEDYVTDSILSVCLMQEDYPQVEFVHRSFQEFFAADFVSRYAGPDVDKITRSFASRAAVDGAFKMLCQMNQMLVIRNWAIETALDVLSRVDEILESTRPRRYAELFDFVGFNFLGFNVENGDLNAFGMTADDTNYVKIENIVSAASPEFTGDLVTLINGNLFKSTFGNGPESVRRVLRLNLRENSWSEVRIEDMDGAWVLDSGIPEIAVQLRMMIKNALDTMNQLVTEEDHLIEISKDFI